MMQQLPAGEAGGAAGTDNSAGNALPAPDATLQNPDDGANNSDGLQNINNNPPVNNNNTNTDQKNNSVPQLP